MGYTLKKSTLWIQTTFSTLFITVFFLISDPALIERRIKSLEMRPEQIVGQSITGDCFSLELSHFLLGIITWDDQVFLYG